MGYGKDMWELSLCKENGQIFWKRLTLEPFGKPDTQE